MPDFLTVSPLERHIFLPDFNTFSHHLEHRFIKFVFVGLVFERGMKIFEQNLKEKQMKKLTREDQDEATL